MAAIQEVPSTKVPKTERIGKRAVFTLQQDQDDDVQKVKMSKEQKISIKEQPAFRMEQIAALVMQQVLKSVARAHVAQVIHDTNCVWSIDRIS